ncbi:MAG: OmpA family protein, partial [Hyphomicrobiaceae bacterium]
GRTVQAPVIEPYEWSFDRLGDVVVLNGYVPDETIRNRLVAVARARYPGKTVTDRMLIADGVPEGFEALAVASLEGTTDLEEVRVVVRGKTVAMTGLAGDQRVVGDVGERLGNGAPGFKVANNLRARETVAPVAAPYVWSARKQGSTIVVAGHVPDAAAREQLLDAARRTDPAADVRDEMTLASGLPGGRSSWLEAASRGLSALAALDEGTSTLTGTALRVTGATSNAEDKQRGDVMLQGDLPSGFASTGDIQIMKSEAQLEAERQEKLAAEEEERKRIARAAEEKRQREAEEEAERKRKADEEAERKRLAAVAATEEAERQAETARRLSLRKDYRLVSEFNGTPLGLWQARRAASSEGGELSAADTASFEDATERSRGKLWLKGKVASEEDKLFILKHARAQFDGDLVDDIEILDGAADQGWLDATVTGLSELSRLRNGALMVTADQIELYGDAVSGDAAKAVRRDIDLKSPGRFDVSFLISAPRALKVKEVEGALETKAPVEAEVCGNLMNSLTSLAPIRFAIASAKLSDNAEPILDKLVVVAQKCPSTRIRISGHTDSNGRSEYNQELSEKRASAVLTYLADRGVERDRLTSRGLGETQPIVGNTTPQQRAKNRRIEFTVTEQ